MSRKIFEAIEVTSLQTDSMQCEYEAITFFELVFVEKGGGHGSLNGHLIPFTSGGVFLVVPDEQCSIKLSLNSLVHFIKFQKVFFDKTTIQNVTFNFKEWFQKLEYIFYSRARVDYPILKSEKDSDTVKSLIKIIVSECQEKASYCDIIVQNSLFSILNIIARNLHSNKQEIQNHNSKNQQILSYIHFNIYKPENLSVNKLAQEFNISVTYFSEYFKSNFDIPLKQYIIKYKIKLAETKLQYTDLSLSEIAYELGFTDINHFRKIFLKYGNMPLGSYRKKLKNELSSQVR
jgi:AraC-like DNA-binding protein